MIHIAIADDHEIVRSGLIMLIEQYENMKVQIEAASFSQLLPLLAEHSIDLLILDLNLGDKNGIELVKIVNDKFPTIPILVLSAYPEDQYALRTLKAGASGYLNKTAISQEVIHAILQITKGGKYISPTLAETLEYGLNLDKNNQDPIEQLSKRELEVLVLIADGKTYKEMAETLDLSPKTISTYRTRILEKLNLTSTSQLLRFAYENNVSSC